MVNGAGPSAIYYSPFTIYHLPAISIYRHARVAQLDRAFDFESKGRRFEPCRAHQLLPKFAVARLR